MLAFFGATELFSPVHYSHNVCKHLYRCELAFATRYTLLNRTEAASSFIYSYSKSKQLFKCVYKCIVDDDNDDDGVVICYSISFEVVLSAQILNQLTEFQLLASSFIANFEFEFEIQDETEYTLEWPGHRLDERQLGWTISSCEWLFNGDK